MKDSERNLEDFDAVLLQVVGEFGSYQKLVLCLLVVTGSFMNAINRFQLAFLMYTPQHQCELPRNFSNYTNVSATQCELHYFHENSSIKEKIEKCNEWNYNKKCFQSTIVTEWNAICDRAIDIKIILSVLMMATVVGCSIYAYNMDRWGRKVAFHIGVATYIFGSTVSLFMPNLLTFTIIRLFSAIDRLATFNISYIWALEYVGPSKRTIVTTSFCGMYGIGMASMSLIAWMCRTWIQMGLACTLPFFLVFSYHFIIMESPRWLISQGRIQDAKEVITKMLKWHKVKSDVHMNRVDEILNELIKGGSSPMKGFSSELGESSRKQCGPSSATELDFKTPSSSEKATASNDGNKSHGNFLDLFRGPTLRKKTLLTLWVWIAASVVHVGLSFNTENLGGNFYVTWALLSLVESAGSLLILTSNKFGRIRPCCLLFILSGGFSLLSAPSDYFSSSLVIIFAMITKLCITASYGIVYQLTGELMPTIVRGIGVGFGSTVGDAGNILMPYIIYSAVAYKMLPMVILGALALSAGIFVLFLPETVGQHMPDTLEDAESFGKVNWETFLGHFKFCGSAKVHSIPIQPATNQAVPEYSV